MRDIPVTEPQQPARGGRLLNRGLALSPPSPFRGLKGRQTENRDICLGFGVVLLLLLLYSELLCVCNIHARRSSRCTQKNVFPS
jgi:hypothetical protein